MYQNRPRRFRRRSNGRNHQRDNGDMKTRHRSNSFSDNQMRNRFRTPQSAEKLFEKYNAMAKEALSSGDKTLSENYFQHADHFMRIIEERQDIRESIEDGVSFTRNPEIDNQGWSTLLLFREQEVREPFIGPLNEGEE